MIEPQTTTEPVAPSRVRRRWPWIAIPAAVLVAVGVTLTITLSGHGQPPAVPITDSSLCSDVNGLLGRDPNNLEYRYLALHEELGSRAGFELACRDNPTMPVTEALFQAPGRELQFDASVPGTPTG